MHDRERPRDPRVDAIERWYLASLVPRSCDLKRHLAERRSIAEALEERRSLVRALAGETSSSASVADPTASSSSPVGSPDPCAGECRALSTGIQHARIQRKDGSMAPSGWQARQGDLLEIRDRGVGRGRALSRTLLSPNEPAPRVLQREARRRNQIKPSGRFGGAAALAGLEEADFRELAADIAELPVALGQEYERAVAV